MMNNNQNYYSVGADAIKELINRIAKITIEQEGCVEPILCNSTDVRAILDGRKTSTRRVIKFPEGQTGHLPECGARNYIYYPGGIKRAPYQPGDILYVRESFRLIDFDYIDGDWSATVQYKADNALGDRLHYLRNGADERIGWRPSIHMPKEAARIFLCVNNVSVERLQDIDDEKAKAEGANYGAGVTEKMRRTSVERFAEIWNSTIKRADLPLYGWDANPLVWVIEFERIN